MAEQVATAWVVGDHLAWIEGGFEEGDITGTIYEVSADGSRVRIRWDDGEQDAEWWDATDEDFTPLSKK